MPELIKEFDYSIDLAGVDDLGRGPFGQRLITNVTGGQFTGDQYSFVDPRMETGDERYSWVNQTLFIGQGQVLPGPRVDYRVFRLANRIEAFTPHH